MLGESRISRGMFFQRFGPKNLILNTRELVRALIGLKVEAFLVS